MTPPVSPSTSDHRSGAFPRLRSSRAARLLVVFMFFPVAMVSNPAVVHAATTARLDFSMSSTGPNVKCQLPVTMLPNGVQATVAANSYCFGGPDLTPGYCQMAEGSCGTWSLTLEDARGAQCSSLTFEDFAHPRNGLAMVAVALGGGIIGTECSDSQEPTEACLNFALEGFLGNVNETSCVAWPLENPEPEPDPEACTNGTVGRPVLTKKPFEYVDTVGGNPRYRWDWELKTELGVSATADTTGGGGWVVYSIHHEKGIGNVTALWSGPDTTYTGRRATRLVPLPPNSATSDTFVFPQLGPTYEADLLEKSSAIEPIGVGVFWATQSSTGSYMFTSHSGLARLGLTWPADCSFYWGARIRKPDDPNKPDGEKPIGPISTPGPDPELPVDPEPIGDEELPETEWGLLGLILGVLRAIASAIGSLASAIASAITKALSSLVQAVLDGLEVLFVPSESLSDRTEEAHLEFADRFPFNMSQALDSIGGPGASSPVMGRAPTPSASAGGGSGCPDWNVRVKSDSYSAVCDSGFTSAIRGARPMIFAGMMAMAFWPLMRGLFFASVPILKPSPGGVK